MHICRAKLEDYDMDKNPVHQGWVSFLQLIGVEKAVYVNTDTGLSLLMMKDNKVHYSEVSGYKNMFLHLDSKVLKMREAMGHTPEEFQKSPALKDLLKRESPDFHSLSGKDGQTIEQAEKQYSGTALQLLKRLKAM